MKTIIVISDTHGVYPDKALWEQFDACDYIIHLGDGKNEVAQLKKNYGDKIISIKGNCDYSTEEFKIIEIEGVKMLITHGHMLGVKNNLLELEMVCQENNVRYALYGHTHEANIEEDKLITFINPGSLTFGKTYCYMTIINKKVLSRIVNLI